MKRMVDDKEIRNFDDRITALEQGGTIDVYTKAESDAKFQTIEGMGTYATKSDLDSYAKLNDDTQTITAYSMTVTPGSGYIHTTYGPSSITMSIPRTPGYTLNIPPKDGTLATTNDIPTYTAGTGIDITNNEVSIDNTVALKTDIPTYTAGSGISISGTTITADSTLARVADIPVITGLVMYNYKITISGLDQGTSTARSAVYIVTLPYQWDYSSLSKYDIIRLVPIWSIVADTATTNSKIMGIFHWQTGTVAQIDWVDGTYTFMSFTEGFDATVEAASPAHW